MRVTVEQDLRFFRLCSLNGRVWSVFYHLRVSVASKDSVTVDDPQRLMRCVRAEIAVARQKPKLSLRVAERQITHRTESVAEKEHVFGVRVERQCFFYAGICAV